MSHTKLLCIACFTMTMLCGCYQRQLYYVSPFNGNSSTLQTIPLRSDSVKSAFYISGSYVAGSANENGIDNFFELRTDLSRTHNLGAFESYYGANLSLGNYRVSSVDSLDNSNTVDYKTINRFAGNKFYGGAGVNGGINIAVPMGRSEWRILGFETSLYQEFGDYLQFRKLLPDTAATLIVRNSFFGIFGLYTQVAIKTRHGSVGFKLGLGGVLGSAYHNLNIYDNESGKQLSYSYSNFAFHFTYDRFTGYMITDFGTKATSLQIGMNYMLGKKSRMAK